MEGVLHFRKKTGAPPLVLRGRGDRALSQYANIPAVRKSLRQPLKKSFVHDHSSLATCCPIERRDFSCTRSLISEFRACVGAIYGGRCDLALNPDGHLAQARKNRERFPRKMILSLRRVVESALAPDRPRAIG